MRRTIWLRCTLIAGFAGLGFSGQPGAELTRVGQFSGSVDIGVTPRQGSAVYDRGAATYRVTGGGENVWGRADAFRFVFSRVSGDVTLTADVHF
jgi:hypothetical protein